MPLRLIKGELEPTIIDMRLLITVEDRLAKLLYPALFPLCRPIYLRTPSFDPRMQQLLQEFDGCLSHIISV